MRTTVAAAALIGALALAPAEASATEIGARPFGLGIQLGAPSGITGKLYMGGRRNAIDFALGAYYDDVFYNNAFVQVSYHWHFPELTSGSGVTIPLRIGVGGWLTSGAWRFGYYRGYDVIIGGRVPFGVDFDLETAPVQFYVEVAFAMAVVPFIGAGLDAGIGFRYYF
jgi:hypothetical protein